MTALSTRVRPALAPGALIPLDDVFARLASRVAVARARAARPLRSAPAPCDLPARDVAARTGHACASADLVGASPQSPAFLPTAPVSVRPGDPLPPGCDCVIPADALGDLGGMPVATGSAHPGEGVRRRAEEARAGDPVPEAILRVLSDDWVDAVVAVTALKASFGLASDGDAARPLLGPSESPSGSGIALTGCFEIEPAEDGFRIPVRLPTLVPFLCGVLLPLADRASLLGPAATALPLTRRIVSAVGVSDLVLLRESDGRFEPLAVGAVPLSALAHATHRAVLPPESEGLPEGALIEAVPL